MLIRRPPDLRFAEITEEKLFWGRREWLASVGLGVAGLALGSRPALCAPPRQTADKLTPYDSVTGYNNFYEFGTGKEDPKENAHTLQPRPWSISVEGDVKRKGTFDP